MVAIEGRRVLIQHRKLDEVCDVSSIKLSDDFNGVDVKAYARRCKEGAQVCRLLALATIFDVGNCDDAALVGGVTRRIGRDWVLRVNADGPDGLATPTPACRRFSVFPRPGSSGRSVRLVL